MGRRHWACAIVVAALPTVGCGGGGQATPTSCLQVQPCGGDVVGTWSFVGTYTATNWHDAYAGTETSRLTCVGASSCTASNPTITDSSNGETATATANCTGTSTCVCHIAGTRTVTTASGSYGAASSVLSVSGGPLPTGLAYCVEENRLHLMRTVNVVTTNPPSDRNIILSDIVAQRR